MDLTSWQGDSEQVRESPMGKSQPVCQRRQHIQGLAYGCLSMLVPISHLILRILSVYSFPRKPHCYTPSSCPFMLFPLLGETALLLPPFPPSRLKPHLLSDTHSYGKLPALHITFKSSLSKTQSPPLFTYYTAVPDLHTSLSQTIIY